MRYFRLRGRISDWFVCSSCGFGEYIKVIGDTCRCPKCNGTMRRT